MPAILAGAFAGLAATVPMTAFMEFAHRRLPLKDRAPLPPRTISMRLVHKLHIDKNLDQDDRKALTLVSHFAFGAIAGSWFGPLTRNIKGSNVAKGTAYGLAVWATNYLGVMPALRILKPATQHSPTRSALMIGAHVIWGATLGLLCDRLQNNRRTIRSLDSTPTAMAG